MDQTTLSLPERRELFDATLQKLCYISVADAGLSEMDVERYVDNACTPAGITDAVITYADHYDLEVSGRAWAP
ncbi:hypothetical protein [Rhodanobacter sp. FW106-PBR-R2A-1-13]|uniref:hypothetical protein n=1 Tax=Rhodanobacter sp. FW106-PBR-R2A-1-13 TaxID=3454845 RepID=UPI0034E4347F